MPYTQLTLEIATLWYFTRTTPPQVAPPRCPKAFQSDAISSHTQGSIQSLQSDLLQNYLILSFKQSPRKLFEACCLIVHKAFKRQEIPLIQLNQLTLFSHAEFLDTILYLSFSLIKLEPSYVTPEHEFDA